MKPASHSTAINRRQILGMAGLALFSGVAGQLPTAAAEITPGVPSPAETPIASARVVFDVKRHGSVGDGKTLDHAAINRAIDACHAAGGGMVYVGPGTYLCGTVILKSHVTLYLEAGATLLGSTNIADFTPQPIRPATQDNSSAMVGDIGGWHLIFARDAENVTLAGPGRIDGQGQHYWLPLDVKKPVEDEWKNVIAFNWKPLPQRPSPLLEFVNCKNLCIENVLITNAPSWTLRPIYCENVFIHGIRILNPAYGVNSDGIDPTCCRNVMISDCVIDVGDDAICLKSEAYYGAKAQISKNITVTNCVIRTTCNAFKFGTRTHGGFENIVFSNSVIYNDDVSLASRVISGICIEVVDGGWVEGVTISNIRMQRTRTPIFIRLGNRTPRKDGNPGSLRGVMIENVHATGSILTSSITGMPGFDVEDITLSNIRIDSEEAGKSDWVSQPVPDLEIAKRYPEANMFHRTLKSGRFPAYGLFSRHAKGLRLRNNEFRADAKEERPVIVCDDVRDLEIAGLRGTPIVGSQPFIKLVQTKQAIVHDCVAPSGSKTFLETQGANTEAIVVMNNVLLGVAQVVQNGKEVQSSAVIQAGNVTGKKSSFRIFGEHRDNENS